MSFEIIKNPHLPTGKVCHIACGSLTVEMKAKLLQYVDDNIELNPVDKLESSLCSHADLLLCPLPEHKIILSESQISLKEKLISLGFYVIIQNDIKSPYPNDCKLNYVDTQHYTIYNNNVHKLCNPDNRKMAINVRQGYVKCSVVPVGSNAIITDDPSIAKRCEFCGMDVCYVDKGDIRLDGYPYGFIGGSCGLVSDKLIVFCGNIESHRDHRRIREFLLKYGIEIACLTDEPLLDVGSLIPLTQMKG